MIDHLNSSVFLSTAGVLQLWQDALALWVQAAHLRLEFFMENLLIKQGTVLGSYFFYSFWAGAFELSPSCTSTPSFIPTGWRAVSIFKFSLQLEVSACWTLLMAWLWQFPWNMTWLFCKLLQVDQAETARCRDLRLSKPWEHLGTVVARFVASGMICLRRLWYLIHGVKAVWDVIVSFLFDSPWSVSDSRRLVSESSLLGFRNLFGFPVKRSRSRAALVFAKCIHVLLLHFLREWHYADHPGARCLGSLTQNMLTFMDIYNPETVWLTGAHPVNWQRPGSWEAQETGGQLLKMGEWWHFLIRSSVAALAFWLRGYHTDSKSVGF